MPETQKENGQEHEAWTWYNAWTQEPLNRWDRRTKLHYSSIFMHVMSTRARTHIYIFIIYITYKPILVVQRKMIKPWYLAIACNQSVSTNKRYMSTTHYDVGVYNVLCLVVMPHLDLTKLVSILYQRNFFMHIRATYIFEEFGASDTCRVKVSVQHGSDMDTGPFSACPYSIAQNHIYRRVQLYEILCNGVDVWMRWPKCVKHANINH